MALYNVQAAALQRKPTRCQIAHGWGEIDSAIEPRLHRVLIRGYNIFQMAGLQRAKVSVDNR
jgi:hypothetical protein